MFKINFVLLLTLALALVAPTATHAGETDDSSTAKRCASQAWGRFLAPGPQSFEVRPDLEIEGARIRPVVFGPIEGRFAKVFLFLQLDAEGCDTAVVSIGSYEWTTRMPRESGSVGPGERLYHADLYLPDGHATLGFMEKPPSYEEALEMALKHLK